MAVNHSNVTVSPPRKNFKYLEKGCPVIPKIVVKIGFVPPKSKNFYIDNISCASCHQKKIHPEQTLFTLYGMGSSPFA